MKRILVLGAGFGGLETATGLAAVLRDGYEITLVDRRDSFFVGFSKIDVLFGRRTEEQVRYRYADLRAENVRFVQATIDSIDVDARRVTTSSGELGYDYLVVALGADLAVDATPGFRESGGHEFYSMAGVVRLRPVIETFTSGRLVVAILGLPYKCPPAPYEVLCQLHDHFVKNGTRAAIEMKMLIPGARPVPNPKLSDLLEKVCAERDIELVTNATSVRIDADAKTVTHAAGATSFDLFVGVPVHVPPAVVRASKLGQAGFIAIDTETLATTVPDVYAIGDVTKVPAGDGMVPKAGAFAEDAARTVVSEILRREGHATERVKFRAKGACYVELDGGLVAKVDADYLGGEKPTMNVEGPSAAMHVDKLAFETTRRDRWFRRSSPA
jgi:sulfide:quinone oxidoreductase